MGYTFKLSAYYVAVPFEKAIDYSEKIKALVNRIDQQYTGMRPKPIPMLPEELSFELFDEFIPRGLGKNLIPIALDTENVEVQCIDLLKNKHLIVGGSQSGKTNMVKLILRQLATDIKIYLIDSKAAELTSYQGRENLTYIGNEEGLVEFSEEIEDEIAQREGLLELEKSKNPTIITRQFYQQMDPMVVIIEDVDNLVEMLKEGKTPTLEKTLMSLEAYNITIIGTSAGNKLKGFDILSRYMKDCQNGIILGHPSEQAIIQIPYMRSSTVPLGIGYMCQKGELLKVKIPGELE